MGRHLLMTTTAWPITGYCSGPKTFMQCSIYLNTFRENSIKIDWWFLHMQTTFTFLHLLINFQIYCSTEPVPDLCKDVDPENPLCQVLGRYSLRLDSQPGVLPRFNYIQPKVRAKLIFGKANPTQEGMFENCPSVAPDYLAPTDC